MTTTFPTADAAVAPAALPGPDWLVARRKAAAERFAALPMPTTEQEVWRYSRIGDLDLAAYAPVATPASGEPIDVVARVVASGDATILVRTRDGHVVDVATDGPATVSHGEALVDDGALGSALGDTGADAITALHDAHATPIVVQVPAGADAGRIVVVHELATAGVATFPRLVVVLGANATAQVLEVHASADGFPGLTIPVTELVVGDGARLSHAAVQLLGDRTIQLARLAAIVQRDGHLEAGTAAFGGEWARLRADTTLAGRGAHGELRAGYFADGDQLLDFRTFQDHAAPDTTSNLLFKGAGAGRGASVYTGLIKIRPEGRGSQAFQTNRNLKLSEQAWAESVPNLEIENNEVQCSHASTVGPVDAEQRFYLESRGVPTERAERLIVRGFFDEVLGALALGPAAELATEALDAELAQMGAEGTS